MVEVKILLLYFHGKKFSKSFLINRYFQEQEIIFHKLFLMRRFFGLLNRGHGAGGKNTNLFGKNFERKTDYCLFKGVDDKVITFIPQHNLKKHLKENYNKHVFRNPDEAFIITSTTTTGATIIKILEKKEQHVEGSVELKLWSAPSLKREYEIVLGQEFRVHYAFCVNDFLKKKYTSEEPKYVTLRQILCENDIQVLFGDDDDYFEQVHNWLLT